MVASGVDVKQQCPGPFCVLTLLACSAFCFPFASLGSPPLQPQQLMPLSHMLVVCEVAVGLFLICTFGVADKVILRYWLLLFAVPLSRLFRSCSFRCKAQKCVRNGTCYIACF